MNINEHDKTKEMMSIIRGDNKKMITENTRDDSITFEPNSGEYKKELEDLTALDSRVKITNFKVYPSDDNVVMEGVFLYREGEDTGRIYTGYRVAPQGGHQVTASARPAQSGQTARPAT